MAQANGTASHQAPLAASNLFFTPLPTSHQVAPGKEKHGRYMLAIPWNRVSGWGQPTIGPRQELKVDPLSGVMQYAVTCFEGMKVSCASLYHDIKAETRSATRPRVETSECLGQRRTLTDSSDQRLDLDYPSVDIRIF
jgi:hypothetical protein